MVLAKSASLEGSCASASRSVRAQFGPARKKTARRIVRLRHDDIDPDRHCAELVRRFDQLCQARARPRPTANGSETALVDIDDHRGKAGNRPRHEALVGVEYEIARRTPKPIAYGNVKQGGDHQQRDGSASPLAVTQPGQQRPGPPAVRQIFVEVDVCGRQELTRR